MPCGAIAFYTKKKRIEVATIQPFANIISNYGWIAAISI